VNTSSPTRRTIFFMK